MHLSNSLHGKPCKAGYDSHYALVKRVGLSTAYLPCNVNDEVGADELVVFNSSQVLPRYLVRFSLRKDDATG